MVIEPMKYKKYVEKLKIIGNNILLKSFSEQFRLFMLKRSQTTMFNRLGQCTAAFASGGFLVSSVFVQQTQPQKDMATAVDNTRTSPPPLVKTSKS